MFALRAWSIACSFIARLQMDPNLVQPARKGRLCRELGEPRGFLWQLVWWKICVCSNSGMDIRCSVVYLFPFNFIWIGKLVLYQYLRVALFTGLFTIGIWLFIIIVEKLFFFRIIVRLRFLLIPALSFPLWNLIKFHKEVLTEL